MGEGTRVGACWLLGALASGRMVAVLVVVVVVVVVVVPAGCTWRGRRVFSVFSAFQAVPVLLVDNCRTP